MKLIIIAKTSGTQSDRTSAALFKDNSNYVWKNIKSQTQVHDLDY